MLNSPEWLHWPETKTLIALCAAENIPIRFGGGCVRDTLLGKAPHDIDIVAIAPLTALKTMLQANNILATQQDGDFGLIAVKLGERQFDMLNLPDYFLHANKRDISRMPEEEIWRLDAQRRDLTINAMHMTADGIIMDYFTGKKDAADGRIRFVGDVEEMIKIDQWRILRFFRFQALYGKIPPDPMILQTIRRHIIYLEKAYSGYVQQEMHHLFAAPKPYEMLRAMIEHDILPHILGFAVYDARGLDALERVELLANKTAQPSVRLLSLILGSGLPIMPTLGKLFQRWNFSADNQEKLQTIVRLAPKLHRAITASDVALLRSEAGKQFISVVFLAWAMSADPAKDADTYLPHLSTKNP